MKNKMKSIVMFVILMLATVLANAQDTVIPGNLFVAGNINGNGGGLTNVSGNQIQSIGPSGTTYIGPRAGNATILNVSNTMIGLNAGLNMIAASNNAAYGVNALQQDTYGYDNTAIGVGSLQKNTDGKGKEWRANTERSRLFGE